MSKEILHKHQGESAIALAQAKKPECAEVVHGSGRSVFITHRGRERFYCRVVPRGENARRRWRQKMGLGT